MKIIRILIFIIGLGIANAGYSQTHEDLYNQAELEKDAKSVVENLIDALALQNPKIPSSKWTEVKSNLDYSDYKQRTIDVLKKHYTLEEIKVIFLQNDMFDPINEEKVFIFKTKEAATEDMYNESKIAGRELMRQAVVLLHQ